MDDVAVPATDPTLPQLDQVLLLDALALGGLIDLAFGCLLQLGQSPEEGVDLCSVPEHCGALFDQVVADILPQFVPLLLLVEVGGTCARASHAEGIRTQSVDKGVAPLEVLNVGFAGLVEVEDPACEVFDLLLEVLEFCLGDGLRLQDLLLVVLDVLLVDAQTGQGDIEFLGVLCHLHDFVVLSLEPGLSVLQQLLRVAAGTIPPEN